MEKYESSKPDRAILNFLIETGYPAAIESTEQLDMLEIDYISEPVCLRQSINTLIKKFAINLSENSLAYTPDAHIKIINTNHANQFCDATVYLKQLSNECEAYAILQRADKVDKTISLPLYTVCGDDIQTLIYDKSNRQLFGQDEFCDIRYVLEQLDQTYSYKAFAQANSIDLKRYMYDENSEDSIPSMPEKIVFYITCGDIKLQPVTTEFDSPGVALNNAVTTFNRVFGTAPSAYSQKPFKLDGASLIIDGKSYTMPVNELQPLFRDLTIFDPDEESLRQCRQSILSEILTTN